MGATSGALGQGLVQGVQQGAQVGNKAAGPVGGVLGGAIGGVVGVFTGVLGAGQPQQGSASPAASSTKQGGSTRGCEGPPKGEKAARQPAVMTQEGEPQLTAEQIVANSDANIERIKAELNLTPEQEKNWTAFNSAMHYLGHKRRRPPQSPHRARQTRSADDIIEQMRNEAQFLDGPRGRSRNVADAAEPLFTSLDAKQRRSSSTRWCASAMSAVSISWLMKAEHPGLREAGRGVR